MLDLYSVNASILKVVQRLKKKKKLWITNREIIIQMDCLIMNIK